MPTVDETMERLRPLAARLVPLLVDSGQLAARAVADKKRVLFEGAQGTLLDIDHGTYPYVTSSSATSGGACTGTGVGPTRIDAVIGLCKAYCTRVGGGPFPTELNDETGERLRKRGDEFGSVTGRPRRTGWLDLPGLRYAARVNGLDGVALTKLDVLTGESELKVCVAYDTPAGRSAELPVDDMAGARPIYKTLKGWTGELGAARSLADLPAAARDYVKFIEDEAGVPIILVSVGYRRDETILIKDPFKGGVGRA
jgi:adenylosuccinate synthase